MDVYGYVINGMDPDPIKHQGIAIYSVTRLKAQNTSILKPA
jgi:hypothetical protein